MKKTLLVFITAVFGWTAPAAYKIRADERAVLELTVEKTGLLNGKKHRFTFSRYDAALEFEPAAPEASTVVLMIDAGSIACQDTWLGAKDLRKVQDYAVKDMLAADRYPRIAFRSTAITKIDSSQYQVQGDLTIRDVSRPVTDTASLQAGANTLPLIEGSARVRLTDFGLKPPTAVLGAIGQRMKWCSVLFWRLNREVRAQRNKSAAAMHFCCETSCSSSPQRPRYPGDRRCPAPRLGPRSAATGANI